MSEMIPNKKGFYSSTGIWALFIGMYSFLSLGIVDNYTCYEMIWLLLYPSEDLSLEFTNLLGKALDYEDLSLEFTQESLDSGCIIGLWFLLRLHTYFIWM